MTDSSSVAGGRPRRRRPVRQAMLWRRVAMQLLEDHLDPMLVGPDHHQDEGEHDGDADKPVIHVANMTSHRPFCLWDRMAAGSTQKVD